VMGGEGVSFWGGCELELACGQHWHWIGAALFYFAMSGRLTVDLDPSD
jgi:hypothetical protein